jgi:serine/threonine protein kinase
MAACKIIIFPKVGGQCIFIDKIVELESAGDSFFKIPGEGGPYYIDRESYGIFASPTYKSYVIVPVPGKKVQEKQLFSLSPLTETEYKKYETEGKIEERKFKAPVVLASGTYGKASLRPTEGTVVKETINKDIGEGLPQDLVKEIAFYSLLREIACLPELFDFGIKFPNFSLRMAAGAETLRKAIENPKRLTPEQKRLIMFRMVSCLRAIASQGIINCDLKPQNAVLTRDGTVLLIDWGVAEIDYTEGQTKNKNTNIQTLWYRAPEILAGVFPYSNKVDIFSIGLIFIEIMTGEAAVAGNSDDAQARALLRIFLDVPKETVDTKEKIFASLKGQVNGSDNSEIIKGVLAGERYEIPDENLRDLIAHMLMFNPKHRYDYDSIVNHRYFAGLNNTIPEQPRYINNMPLIPDVNTIYVGDINVRMRQILFDWLKEVANSKRYTTNTLCLSYQLCDLYVQKTKGILRKHLQLIGISAMLIATKIHENWPIDLRECARVCDNIYRSNEIEDMEQKILFTLNGNICIPTLHSYFEQYKPSISADVKTRNINMATIYSQVDIYAKPFASHVGVVLPKMVYMTPRPLQSPMPAPHPVDLVKPGPERGKYGQSPRSGKRPTPSGGKVEMPKL